jgi:hypothetical protein
MVTDASAILAPRSCRSARPSGDPCVCRRRRLCSQRVSRDAPSEPVGTRSGRQLLGSRAGLTGSTRARLPVRTHVGVFRRRRDRRGGVFDSADLRDVPPVRHAPSSAPLVELDGDGDRFGDRRRWQGLCVGGLLPRDQSGVGRGSATSTTATASASYSASTSGDDSTTGRFGSYPQQPAGDDDRASSRDDRSGPNRGVLPVLR